jgi:hypothetical protein
MKKLFVLFLLVALVPFTVGCGLFGDNDDTTPVSLPVLKAAMTGIKVPASLNAVLSPADALKYVKDRNVQITLNDVPMMPESAEETAAGVFSIIFTSGLISSDNYSRVINGNSNGLVIIAVTGDTLVGTNAVAPVSFQATQRLSGNALVVPVVAGVIQPVRVVPVVNGTPSVTATPVVTIQPAPATAAVFTYTVKDGTKDVATTAADATMTTDVTPKFTVALTDSTKSINMDNVEYSIKVRNVAGKEAIDLPENVLSLNPTSGTAVKSVEITVNGNTNYQLKGGQKYEVEIVSFTDGANFLKTGKFYFVAR